MKSLEPCMFRATPRAWLGELALPFLFLSVAIYTIFARLGLPVIFAGLGIGLLSVYAVRGFLLPMLRSWILFDRSAIEGSLNGKEFHLYYGEILAAWQIERMRWRFLCLGTRRGTIVYPLRFFDENAIWTEVALRAPADALAETAIMRLPDYQEWAREREHWISRKDAPRVAADHWTLQVAGWGSLVFALYNIVLAFQSGDMRLVIALVVLAALALVILIFWGVTEVSGEHVRRSTVLKNTTIAWADVQQIEMDPFGLAIAILGEGCQLVIPGPAFWSRFWRNPTLEFLMDQAHYKRVPVRRTLRALLRFTYFSRERR